jgi:gluconate 2-dehydrogenase gamma chain
MPRETPSISRRRMLHAAGLAGLGVTLPAGAVGQTTSSPSADAAASPQAPSAPTNTNDGQHLFYFTPDEAAFVRAAVDRLVPGEPEWGGAEAAGVLTYIDRQLAGGFGAGAGMYLHGPWTPQAPPNQGYQLRHTPAALYRQAIEEIRPGIRDLHSGNEIWALAPDDIDTILRGLEDGSFPTSSVPSAVFFETLLANTVEGYFADPVYGGNRNMVSWRMIGFPGAYADYVELVDQYDYAFEREPLSIASAHDMSSTHKHG